MRWDWLRTPLRTGAFSPNLWESYERTGSRRTTPGQIEPGGEGASAAMGGARLGRRVPRDREPPRACAAESLASCARAFRRGCWNKPGVWGLPKPILLRIYPTLRAEDLANAWAYVRSHREEISRPDRGERGRLMASLYSILIPFQRYGLKHCHGSAPSLEQPVPLSGGALQTFAYWKTCLTRFRCGGRRDGSRRARGGPGTPRRTR